MARTEIPVDVVGAYQYGKALTKTAGDSANNMMINAKDSPRLHLLVVNTGGNTVSWQYNWKDDTPYQYGATAAVAGPVSIDPDAVEVTVLDMPSYTLEDGYVYIDSVDANFADLNFSAFTWQTTPKCGGGSGYQG